MAQLIYNPEIKALIHPTIISNPHGEGVGDDVYIEKIQSREITTSIGPIRITGALYHKRGGSVEFEELSFSIQVRASSQSNYSFLRNQLHFVTVLVVYYLWYPNGAKLAEIFEIRTNVSDLGNSYDSAFNKAYIWNQDGTPLMDANFETNQFYKFNNDGSYTQLTLTYGQADELIIEEIDNLNPFASQNLRQI